MKAVAKLIVVLLTLVVLCCGNLAYAQTGDAKKAVKYKGINIAGAEFNGTRKHAMHFKDYIWPTNKNLLAMKQFGFNTVRIPFAWERMQPLMRGELNSEQTKHMDRVVQLSHQLGLYVIIDPHNYGKYYGRVLNANPHDLDIFADFWYRIAQRYGAYPNVIFGLMNEPYKQSAQDWAKLAQAGINAIRKTGSEQLILVPGTRWSGMHSWQNAGQNSNARALLAIEDPVENYAYEMHQYFDQDYSGTHNKPAQQCIPPSKVISLFQRTTKWLKENNKKAFLGEFGVQENESCLLALQETLDYMNANSNNWIGWTYWTAGDWMESYPFNVFSKKALGNTRLELLKLN